MRLQRRTTLAAVLIGIAVLLPTAAWYVTGSREASRQAEALRAEGERRRHDEVAREATRLGARLESLRVQEAERPFFHYQTLYRDPRGAAEGLAVTPSPLTSGRTDPLVLAHFQIDESGLVTVPAVSERFPELSNPADFDAFCTLLEELQSAVVMDEIDSSEAGADAERVLTMTHVEWEQIALAETVYASITGRQSEDEGPVLNLQDIGRVAIRVRPLRWRTMVLGSGPALAAVRDVHTPSGVLLQGFMIAPLAVEQWLRAGTVPLKFVPGPAPFGDSVTSPVGGTGWFLDLEAGDEEGPEVAEAREVVARFRHAFALTAGAVMLSASAVILILFQTDRLARQRARFAAAAAHELKTPLASLLLHAEMLAENLGDTEHRSQYAATVGAEADRLGRVVSNMLDLARLERSVPFAVPRAGNLGRAISERVERHRARLEEAGLNVMLEIEPELPDALFDPDALDQILDNLLDNAEKHTRATENRQLSITVRRDDHCLRIEVADNGPGIPRSQRRAMFRPFDRAADAVGRPGLGLGLAVARSLARAQGGELELASNDRPGAIFVLTLPRVET
jgi:signal transduction histidine kinase